VSAISDPRENTAPPFPTAKCERRGDQALKIGGVSILIVVSVVLEFIKHTESQLAMRSYEGF
jgi:preprotein translocase subunit SecY